MFKFYRKYKRLLLHVSNIVAPQNVFSSKAFTYVRYDNFYKRNGKITENKTIIYFVYLLVYLVVSILW